MISNSDNSVIYTFASLIRRWEDLTDAHRDIRERAEKAVDEYVSLVKGRAQEASPLIIAGGLGSGKTQLLYHLFKYSWKEKQLPALYVNLRTVIDKVREGMSIEGETRQLSPRELTHRLLELALKRLDLLKKHFNDNTFTLGDLWLPEIEGRPAKLPPSELFKEVGINPSEAYALVDQALKRKWGIILLIDEVEMAYKELSDLITGGFRDLMDIIGRGTAGIYTVMAVSYLSYYELFLTEFTGDIAYARRVELVHIPPVDPDVLYERLKPLNIGDKSNTFWWFTRARLGWVKSLKDIISTGDRSIGDLLELTKAPQLRTLIAENLPILDMEELTRFEDSYCRGDEYCKASLRFFLLNIKPCRIDYVPQFVRERVGKLSAALVWCDELTDESKVVDAFIHDIKEFYDREGIELDEKGLGLIEKALDEILSALASREEGSKKLCIGGSDIYNLADITPKYIDAILDILMAYIAENYGTGKRERRAIEALYSLHSLALSKGKWEEHSTFRRVKELFQAHIGKKYVMIGPWILRALIPMYLSNPIVSKRPGLDVETLNQRLYSFLQVQDVDTIIDIMTSLSEFVLHNEIRDNIVLYLVPLPRIWLINKQQVEEKIYNVIKGVVQQHLYDIKYGSKRVIFFFTGDNNDFIREIRDKLGGEDTLLDLLLNKTRGILIEPIPRGRLSDFVRSVFVLLAEEKSISHPVSIEGIIRTLEPDQRRRVEYFSTTLGKWISDAIKNFSKEREEKLYVDELHRLQSKIVNDLNALRYIIGRTQKFRPYTRAYAAFFTSIPSNLREPFEAMRSTLSPGGLIRVKALPSIYQEFQMQRRDVKCISVMELLKIPIISAIVSVTLEDKRGVPLVEALSVLEEENLPFYNDFVEILEKTLNIRRSEWDNELRMLYRLILLNMLLNMRKDDILNLYFELLNRVKNITERLKDLLEEINSTSNNLCKNSPLCIKITIQPRDRVHSLNDEIRGILEALSITEQWARELQSGRYGERFIVVAFMAVFGLPEEDGILLNRIEASLKEWYNGLYEKVYEKLRDLQQKLNQLPIEFPSDIEKREVPIRIESLRGIDSAGDAISNVLGEVEDLVKDYNRVFNEVEECRHNIQTLLKRVLDDINRLEEVYRGLE